LREPVAAEHGLSERAAMFLDGRTLDEIETQAAMLARGERSVLCSMPGCPRILDEPGRCPEHRTDGWSRFRAGDHDRAPPHGYGARWRRLRDLRIRDHPVCDLCRLRPA